MAEPDRKCALTREQLQALVSIQAVAAIGRPDDTGARIVDDYADDLRRLADA